MIWFRIYNITSEPHLARPPFLRVHFLHVRLSQHHWGLCCLKKLVSAGQLYFQFFWQGCFNFANAYCKYWFEFQIYLGFTIVIYVNAAPWLYCVFLFFLAGLCQSWFYNGNSLILFQWWNLPFETNIELWISSTDYDVFCNVWVWNWSRILRLICHLSSRKFEILYFLILKYF